MIINCNVKDNSKTPVAIETTEVVALEGFLISESGHSGMEVGSEASSLNKEKWKMGVIFDPVVNTGWISFIRIHNGLSQNGWNIKKKPLSFAWSSSIS